MILGGLYTDMMDSPVSYAIQIVLSPFFTDMRMISGTKRRRVNFSHEIILLDFAYNNQFARPNASACHMIYNEKM